MASSRRSERMCCSTRNRSRPRSRRRSRTGMGSGSGKCTPGKECTPVMPKECSSRCASVNQGGRESSTSGTGRRPVTRRPAHSSRMPVGSPVASRWMSPPSGSGVSAVMPAAARAARVDPEGVHVVGLESDGAVAQRRRPAGAGGARHRSSGCRSSRGRGASRCPGGPGAGQRACAAARGLAAAARSTCWRAKAHSVRWMCASTRPGVRTAPGRSTTCARRPDGADRPRRRRRRPARYGSTAVASGGLPGARDRTRSAVTSRSAGIRRYDGRRSC
jgi:hypothetical protein